MVQLTADCQDLSLTAGSTPLHMAAYSGHQHIVVSFAFMAVMQLTIRTV
jgi:hypothetical protein